MNCLSEDEKKKYLDKINHNHNYKFDKNNRKFKKLYFNSEYKICDNDELKLLKVFDDSTVKSLLNLMDKTIKFLDDNNITYWIDSGTLLGASRNSKFIPWDDDVDLAIPYDSFIKIKEIIKNYPKQMDGTDKYRVCEKYKIKFIELTSNIPLDVTKPFLIKTFHLDGKLSKEDVFIDLMNYFCIDNKKYVSNINVWINKFFYYTDNIYPLKKINFEGRKLNCVNKPEIFLKTAYLFWKDLALASHAHFKYLQDSRSEFIYFLIK